jgi:hypothetical protein
MAHAAGAAETSTPAKAQSTVTAAHMMDGGESLISTQTPLANPHSTAPE